jgi:copper(I)-binding protein
MRALGLTVLAVASCVTGSPGDAPNANVTASNATLSLSTLVDDVQPNGYPSITFANHGTRDAAIVGVESTISDGGGLSITITNDDTIERKHVESLPIAAGGTLEVAHKANEIALYNITPAPAPGDTFTLMVHFNDQTVLALSVSVAE